MMGFIEFIIERFGGQEILNVLETSEFETTYLFRKFGRLLK